MIIIVAYNLPRANQTFKGDQSWVFIRRTDAEAEILWPPDAKS